MYMQLRSKKGNLKEGTITIDVLLDILAESTKMPVVDRIVRRELTDPYLNWGLVADSLRYYESLDDRDYWSYKYRDTYRHEVATTEERKFMRALNTVIAGLRNKENKNA